MSDDEPDHELLALLAQSLIRDGSGPQIRSGPTLPVLKDAEYINDNATDVFVERDGVKAASSKIWQLMQDKSYSRQTWSQHELHPSALDGEATVNFIFTMDLLNFSFWADGDGTDPQQVFAVNYRGKRRTGYWSLVACLQRALEEGIPITSSAFWVNEAKCTDEMLERIFRSDTDVEIPLLEQRIHCIRKAGDVLRDRFNGSFLDCIDQAAGSAVALVDLLVDNFPCFDDKHVFEERTVRFYKRAQILVADLWACFDNDGYGHFDDIDELTMFADYRIPQMLHILSCLRYAPALENKIEKKLTIASGDPLELQLRGCSIWCVEQIRQEIKKQNPTAEVNAVIIDFFLYDLAKEIEARGDKVIPHHRTRSIWY